VSGNTAIRFGGGIYAYGMALVNDTITRNTAFIGGGVVHASVDPATIKNTIIAGNLLTTGGARKLSPKSRTVN
jgi:hypothetical protein